MVEPVSVTIGAVTAALVVKSMDRATDAAVDAGGGVEPSMHSKRGEPSVGTYRKPMRSSRLTSGASKAAYRRRGRRSTSWAG